MGKMPWEDLDCSTYSKWTETERLTDIERWEGWLVTVADGMVPTDQKMRRRRKKRRRRRRRKSRRMRKKRSRRMWKRRNNRRRRIIIYVRINGRIT